MDSHASSTGNSMACAKFISESQVPLSRGFLRQEYWSGLPCPSPRDLPDLGMEPGFPALQVDSLPAELPGIMYKRQ